MKGTPNLFAKTWANEDFPTPEGPPTTIFFKVILFLQEDHPSLERGYHKKKISQEKYILNTIFPI
jgi:hypothetical protein